MACSIFGHWQCRIPYRCPNCSAMVFVSGWDFLCLRWRMRNQHSAEPMDTNTRHSAMRFRAGFRVFVRGRGDYGEPASNLGPRKPLIFQA